MTRRQIAALNFIITYRRVCALYGCSARRAWADFRVRAARLRYLASVAADCWQPAA